ncbi:excinuclease ABC subunit C [Candidatus Phytoplasma phoenicium]|uniref:UvrABC system protein C n=1 Tax=Candidatus Phytoplasma phoenicium TaxID=198422 RepID=A0A2S8NVB7_9MOLU|nr:excinuclease ABC subunit C [Candidatus Phytoplasma phoenicium]
MLLELKKKLSNLPSISGCYFFKNKEQKIIYVGKAKNIKNRIKSYYYNINHNLKTKSLIDEVTNIEYILTNNEKEAFILEADLIKKHKPKYNFKSLDDKTYPYIEITNETHPRLKLSHYKQIPSDKRKRLFGPFPNNESTRETVRFLYKLYPLRRCHPIANKACFYYQIKQCLGPCCQKEVDYQPHINAIVSFLKGNDQTLMRKIYKSMQKASRSLEFEKAAQYKKLFIHLQNIVTKQTVNVNLNYSCDIIACVYNNDNISLYILRTNQGRIFDYFQAIFSYVGEAKDNIITTLNLYYQNNLLPKEIILDPFLASEKIYFKKTFLLKICIPKKNMKFDLYQLSLKNAKENLLKADLHVPSIQETYIPAALDYLTQLFRKKIEHIEVFDNSHLFGTSFVTGMIVFRQNKLYKTSYRKFHLSPTLQSEFRAFQNVIERRYKTTDLNEEYQPTPDLILVDGGIGQLRICQETLKKMGLDISVGALQKNNKHEFAALILLDETVTPPTHDPLFRFLKYLSSEVHRFTIQFHHQVQKKNYLHSCLTNIPGLGPQRYRTILQNFANIQSILQASCSDFEKINIPCRILTQIQQKYITSKNMKNLFPNNK